MNICKAIFAALAAMAVSTGEAVTHHPGPYVPLCSHIALTASYLAEAEPGNGPGFVFVIRNDTNNNIRLADPFHRVRTGMRMSARSGCGAHRAAQVAVSWTPTTRKARSLPISRKNHRSTPNT